MKTEHKLYAAIAVIVVLGLVVYFVRKGEDEEAQTHTKGAAVELPSVSVDKKDLKKITKIEIKNKGKDQVVLVKLPSEDEGGDEDETPDAGEEADKDKKDKYGEWKLVKPVEAPANNNNVKSLIDNLEKIEVKDLIASSPELYDKYEVTEEKAVHVKIFAGEDTILEAYFGKSGSRGQMMRVAGKDGVYVAKGYSSYLYAREVKNWRNTEIWKFDDTKVTEVTVENENGKFHFTKEDDDWKGSFTKRTDDKLAAAPEASWERFDGKKVKDLLRAYKNLRANDFGKEGDDTGLADPVSNGGLVYLKLEGEPAELTLKVGKVQENKNRYAQKEGDETVFVLSSWSGDWAVAEPSKFEKPEEKDKDADEDEDEDKDKDKDKDKTPKAKPKPKSKPKPPPRKSPPPKSGGDDIYD